MSTFAFHRSDLQHSHSFCWLCLQKLDLMSNTGPFRSTCVSSRAPGVWFLTHPPLPCAAELTPASTDHHIPDFIRAVPQESESEHNNPHSSAWVSKKSPNCALAPVLQGNTQGNPLLFCEPCLELLLEFSSYPLFLDMCCGLQGHEDLGTDLRV